MQDFRVHFKHEDGSTETVPFFGLKTNKLKDVFAPSCMSCFDYVNSLADLVVGYMGAPFGWQWIVVRNDTGKEMLDLVKDQLDTQPFKPQKEPARSTTRPRTEQGTPPLPDYISTL